MILPVHANPKFAVGQLVQHRRYHYRGVIAAYDLTCAASEEWYHRNQTQPDRAQPWYHVLVDGGGSVTYAAETSLLVDTSVDPIEHPWIEALFIDFTDGWYVRNDTPFPPA